jgi:hypothetical protein
MRASAILGYLHNLGLKSDSDPLRYEKRLIDDWVKRQLASYAPLRVRPLVGVDLGRHACTAPTKVGATEAERGLGATRTPSPRA